MSDFDTWDEVYSWMYDAMWDTSKGQCVIFPHKSEKGLEMVATSVPDYRGSAWDISFRYNGTDINGIFDLIQVSTLIYHWEFDELWMEKVKAFCGDPKTVTVMKDDNYDE